MNINKSLHHALEHKLIPVRSRTFRSNSIRGMLVSTPSWTPFTGDVNKSKIGE